MEPVTINGRKFRPVNAFSCSPECNPHTYQLRNGAFIRSTPIGWIMEYRGQGDWIPELNCFAILL